jgi:anti-sigma regulatory factor (Ser/Thr protein kinase)
VEDAVLIVSELAANAVLHAKTSFSLSVTAKGPRLRIAVTDFRPLASEQEMVARMPHGLGVVNALAWRWGVDALPHGKVVWAELSR